MARGGACLCWAGLRRALQALGSLDRAEGVPEKSPGWNPWCGLGLLAEYQTPLRDDLWGPSRG